LSDLTLGVASTTASLIFSGIHLALTFIAESYSAEISIL
jgi:hypothetical protein